MAAPRYISSFAAPTEYERQAAEARRRQAMAEALEAQAYQPLSGSAAPTPSAAPLVMALQSFLSARQRRKAEEAGEQATQMEQEFGRRIAGRLEGGYTPPSKEEAARVFDKGQRTAEQIMAATPVETTLQEVTPTAQYRKAPQEALSMAMTPLGMGAMKRAPLLAAALEKSMETPTAEEFYAPVAGATGTYVQFGKRGGVKESTVAAPSEAKGTELSRLISERAALKPGDPNIAIYDAAIKKETTRPTGPVTNVYSGSAIAGVDDEGNPIYAQLSRTGGEPSIVKGIRPAPQGMNENQAKAAGFADRINESSPVLNTAPQSVGASVLSGVPGGNFALTPEQQTFFQAERNFINAVLRRESGAVISPEEFSNARMQYIPQPGDSPQVLEQKRRNRETVQRSFARDAGPSYKPVIDLPPR